MEGKQTPLLLWRLFVLIFETFLIAFFFNAQFLILFNSKYCQIIEKYLNIFQKHNLYIIIVKLQNNYVSFMYRIGSRKIFNTENVLLVLFSYRNFMIIMHFLWTGLDWIRKYFYSRKTVFEKDFFHAKHYMFNCKSFHN